MINWKCHTKDENKKPMCIKCGTNKKALQKCSTVIPVKEWTLAPRTKDAAGNVTSTQVELSDSDPTISVVVQRLKLQLEICRTHNGKTTGRKPPETLKCC
jgi:hypothetical protein